VHLNGKVKTCLTEKKNPYIHPLKICSLNGIMEKDIRNP
jgi:hypothetical protein